jgi:hypothetical protein
MKTDPVGLIGMEDKLRTYLGSIDLKNISRKYHNQVLYTLACNFRTMRSIKNKKVVVN